MVLFAHRWEAEVIPIILISDEAGLFVALETSPVLRIGCTLVPIRSAAELPAQAATVSPDLILLDAECLGDALHPALKTLKLDRKLQHVPIIVATKDAARCRSWVSATDVVLPKPVDPDTVVTNLKKLLPLPRRAGPRVPLSVPVVCHLGRRRVTLKLKDIASGGVFIRMPEALTRGTRFDATFAVPDPVAGGSVSHTISATCEVVREVRADDADLIPGVGVAFVKIDRTEAGHVRRFVSAAAP